MKNPLHPIEKAAEAAYWDMYHCGADETDPRGFKLLGNLREAARRGNIVMVAVYWLLLKKR